MFGVCALGVSSLYLVPGLTRVQPQAQRPVGADPAPSRTGGSGVRPVTEPVDQGTTAGRPSRTTSPPSTTAAPASDPTIQPTRARPAPTATARDPRPSGQDDQAPLRVEKITAATSTHDRLDLHWAPATDNVAVVGYTVSLNGYPVATTTGTHARLRWFNDDSTRQLVAVTAIDAAGNESETAAVVVSRPSDDPSPTPTAAPTTPAPAPSPSETTSDPAAPAESVPQASASASAGSTKDQP